MNRSFVINGYEFPSEKEVAIAKQEEQMIQMISKKLENASKDDCLILYKKLITKRYFKTIIGYEYLNGLRNKLIQEYAFPAEEIPCIPIIYRGSVSKINQNEYDKLTEQNLKLKSSIKQRNFITIFLGMMIIVMIIIAATNDNVGYINTENKILNKYSYWEEELQKREKAVSEREKALEQTP